jgi:hypothetical protein
MDEEVMDHNENVKEVEGKVVGKAFLSSWYWTVFVFIKVFLIVSLK